MCVLVTIMKIQRRNELAKYVSEKNMCTYEELAAHFNVSMSTLRRDIDDLAKSGHLQKIYGGVLAPRVLAIPDSMLSKDVLSTEHKLMRNAIFDRIAVKAASLVEDGDIIILGTGYTVYHMLHYLADKKNLTIITNNLLVLYDAIYMDCRVCMLGGDVNSKNFSVSSQHSMDDIRQFNAHKAFLGCSGVATGSFVNLAELEAKTKSAMISSAEHNYILADSSKFGRLSVYTFASFADVDAVITDTAPDEKYFSAARSSGMDILVCPPEE